MPDEYQCDGAKEKTMVRAASLRHARAEERLFIS
jgi:hypothetical protein